MGDTIENIIREDLFPGNLRAYEELRTSLDAGETVAFVGAGASYPLLPTWSSALSALVKDAVSAGVVSDPTEIAELKSQISKDPLEVAELLQGTFGYDVFRSRISTIFSGKENASTELNRLIVRLPFRSIVTVNYDQCLENAYAEINSRYPKRVRGEDDSELTKFLQTQGRAIEPMVLHLHGVTEAPNGMIFTSSDYHNAYVKGNRSSFVEQIWKFSRLLVIGFSFTDPFLISIAENCLRSLPSGLRHFALIGQRSDRPISKISRQIFSNKYRLTPIFYPVRVSENNDGSFSEDHSGLLAIIEQIQIDRSIVAAENKYNNKIVISDILPDEAIPAEVIQKEFSQDLFTNSQGESLYVDPRLIAYDNLDDSYSEKTFNVRDIMDAAGSFLIESLPEAGATTLARRLKRDFVLSGLSVQIRDASSLPNYRKKLQEEFGESDPARSDMILIIDNFKSDQNERMLKEIVSLNCFQKIILLSTSIQKRALPLTEFVVGPVPFKYIKLDNLSRSDIRTLAEQLFDTKDEEYISTIVAKVYKDLLDLCIPLTPGNVLMYLRVLYREGDFSPLNRVQIVNRYISEILRRPSDIYRDSFGSVNKMDVVSAFAYSLFQAKSGSFDERDWFKFCRNHMERTLTEFDAAQLLADLLDSRVLLKISGILVFKYRFFFSFFLGRYLSSRSEVMKEFIRQREYANVEAAVEVISGLSSDNSLLVQDLVTGLENCISQFRMSYVPADYDPLSQAEWALRSEDEERVWKEVQKEIEIGPRGAKEIDALKSSLVAENRTLFQEVTFQNFDKLEQRLINFHFNLRDALRNSESIDGELKIRAVLALIEGYKIFYQVALLLGPVFLKRNFFVWHGILYIVGPSARDENGILKSMSQIIPGWMRGVISKATDDIGSKKLSKVFSAVVEQKGLTDFSQVLALACLTRTKPSNWQQVCERSLSRVERKAYYLHSILKSLIREFRDEVNTGQERDALKHAMALIQAKRSLGKTVPGAKAVSRVFGRMQEQSYFQKLLSDRNKD